MLQWWRSDERDCAGSHLKKMQDLFRLKACQVFLLHHENDGIDWFNKERFEELQEWVALLSLIDGCSATISPRSLSMKMGEAERSIITGAKLAQDVGYRSRLFVELPEKSVQLRVPKVKKSAV